MTEGQVWSILSIKETKDKDIIKNAYREKLLNVNPEDDPEGFKRLREAYEMALKLADEVTEDEPKTEMDLWIDKAAQIYNNIYRRTDKKEYISLFEEEICAGLDTCDEARERFIAFLMSHYNLPQDIYKIIDNEFSIIQSKNELIEKFPADFIDYLEYQITHPAFINYSLFKTTGLSDDEADADAYINSYFEVRRLFDEENYQKAKEIIKEAESFEIYHPYMEAEVMRISNMEKNVERTFEICNSLMEEYGKDKYIKYICAAILYDNERYEEAMKHMNALLEEDGSHYGAKLYVVKEEKRLKNYDKAKKILFELMERNRHDSSLEELMNEINAEFKGELLQKYKASGLAKDGIEYAWCLFQDRNYDGAISFLEELEQSEVDEYEYTNLYGRSLFGAKRYEEATPYIEKWKDMIFAAEDDGSEEYQKKQKRKGVSYAMLAACHTELEKYEVAIEYYEKAVEAELMMQNRLSYMDNISICYIKLGKNEKAVDMCDRIIEIDRNYYPAYVNRQEAYFNLKRGREVIEDYYNAVGLYNGYYKPYYYAAKVFYLFRQYEDAKEVIKAAKENNCYEASVEFVDLKIDRFETKTENETRTVIKRLIDFRKRIKSQDIELDENKAEVTYEISLAYMDCRSYEDALRYIDKAIREDSEAYNYLWTKADILKALEEYSEAGKIFRKLIEAWPENAELHYELGMLYMESNGKNKAKKEFLEALKYDPEHRDANNCLMKIYQQEYEKCSKPDLYETALMYANKQIEINPDRYYYNERGLLYMAAGEYEKSIADYMKALEYCETDMFAYNNAGVALKVLGRYEEAIEMLEKSISLMKEQGRRNKLPYNNLAECYEILGEYEKAIKCYENNLVLFPKDDYIYDSIVGVYKKMKDFNSARITKKKSLTLKCIEPEDYSLEATEIYVLKGNSEKARKELTNAGRIMSDNNWKTAGDRWLYCFREYKNALMFYKRALENIDESNIDAYAQVLSTLSRCYFFSGDKESSAANAMKAIDAIIRVCGSVDNYTGFIKKAPYRMGVISELYLYIGKRQEALAYAEKMDKVLRCSHCCHKVCYEKNLYKGLYYETDGQYEEALECYREAFALDETDTELLTAIKAMEKLI